MELRKYRSGKIGHRNPSFFPKIFYGCPIHPCANVGVQNSCIRRFWSLRGSSDHHFENNDHVGKADSSSFQKCSRLLRVLLHRVHELCNCKTLPNADLYQIALMGDACPPNNFLNPKPGYQREADDSNSGWMQGLCKRCT